MPESNDNCDIKRWDLLKRRLQNVSPRQALEMMENAESPLVLIDCRRPDEYQKARLPDALHVDYLDYDFWERIARLSPVETYLVYCNSCRRSTRACTLMQNGGFSRVYNLDGGLNRWLEELGKEGLELD